jgi:hypothetical protein
LGWSTPPTCSSPRSFIELSTFLKPCVSRFIKALCYSSLGALSNFGDGVSRKWGEGGKKGEVGRREFWGREGAEKSLGKGRGCVFGSSPKWLKQPHHELVHWWLLVQSSWFMPLFLHSNICKNYFQILRFYHRLQRHKPFALLSGFPIQLGFLNLIHLFSGKQ